MSLRGAALYQQVAQELLCYENITLLCGITKGSTSGIIEEIVDEEISIGDFVLTGGEIPAAAVIDCVCRMDTRVLATEQSYTEESHFGGLLEYPQYTRPPVFLGKEVPEVLRSGHHANIEKWRKEESIKRTLKKRPDLLEGCALSPAEEKFLARLREKQESEE
jgi:tRNA (guanine37-N1)-methyltransferase